MEPFSFTNIINIKKSTQFSVFGYIRQNQALLNPDNPYYNIPDLVCYICIAYLAEIEYFTVFSDGIKLGDDGKRITKIVSAGFAAAYGNVDINMDNDNCIHQ